MCNNHVLECPLNTNNSLALDCQSCVETVLEDDFGFNVHNLQDLVPRSSSTCLKEPDFVVAGNEGLFNGGYDLISNTLSGVSLIAIQHKAAIEREADRGFGCLAGDGKDDDDEVDLLLLAHSSTSPPGFTDEKWLVGLAPFSVVTVPDVPVLIPWCHTWFSYDRISSFLEP